MPAGKRAKVSAAFHSELSEYSSLLRALRTNATLDLTSHVTSHAQATTSGGHGLDADDDDDDDEESAEDVGDGREIPADTVDELDQSSRTSTSVYEGDTQANDVDQTSKLKSSRKKKSKVPRDTWTRWPLLAGDVHVPEWSLQDEVKLLALQHLEVSHISADNSYTSAELPRNDEEVAESLLPSHALNALTESTGCYLSQILALLAAYIPPGEKSMQNRVRPLSWENVLTIAVANGMITADAMETISQRLLAIYPGTRSDVLQHRYPSTGNSARDDLGFLAVDGYDPDVDFSSMQPTASSSGRARIDGQSRKSSSIRHTRKAQQAG